MMKRHFISVVLGGVLALWLVGGTSAPGLRAADPKAPPPAAPAGGSGGPLANPLSAAVLPPAPTYEYNAIGKPDPFKPFMETDPAQKAKIEAAQKKKATVKGGFVSPLQRMDIGQYRLVGIAGNDKKRSAIVEDAVEKKHYPLFVGTYIGMNQGRIVAIQPDRVVIEEPLQVQPPKSKKGKKAKKTKVRRITVMLHEEEEGKP